MRRKFAIAILAMWAVVGVLVGGIMMLRHVAFRVPLRSDASLRAGVSTLFAAREQWGAVHVLYRSCACSTKTLAHLLTRGVSSDVDEVVVIADDAGAGAADDERLRQRGFRVVIVRPDELRSRFGLEAAPVLVVREPTGDLAYVGGYNWHKQQARFADVAIIEDARRVKHTDALPVFGCATSARLATAVNPLGWGEKRVQQ